MAGVIDTNILLYAVNASADEHELAHRFLQGTTSSPGPWYLTEGIIYEFFRVSTHARVFTRPLSWRQGYEFLEALLARESFRLLIPTEDHLKVLGELLEGLDRPAGNLFFDVRTATLMREHGVRRIYTADTDFLQFADLEVINPAKTSSRRGRSH